MTTSLATFIEYARRDLRDESATPAFSDDELTDLIIAGISELAQFYPKEVISTVTLVADTPSYPLPSDIKWVFRVERYTAEGKFAERIPESSNDQGAGWQVHADTLFVPNNGEGELHLWGYGPWSNFGWPSDAGGWWVKSLLVSEEPSSLGTVTTGDAFAIWAANDVTLTGAAYDSYPLGDTDVAVVFTEDGEVFVSGSIAEGSGYALIHKLPTLTVLGA